MIINGIVFSWSKVDLSIAHNNTCIYNVHWNKCYKQKNILNNYSSNIDSLYNIVINGCWMALSIKIQFYYTGQFYLWKKLSSTLRKPPTWRMFDYTSPCAGINFRGDIIDVNPATIRSHGQHQYIFHLSMSKCETWDI